MSDVHLTIDGNPVVVPSGTTVYQACFDLGIEIPIFCYHDRMPPFGACRVCLVEVDKMGKLQTSCTLEAKEGMAIKTQSALAVEGRKSILEFLLINHPLDCPICDRGGECPLQEQALSFGPGTSRFLEEKRHFIKPKPLGPVLMLDRERCIACARCTRFGELISGDHALEFFERGFKTEVGTPNDGTAESKYIGNTITICPVGALTSQVYRFRARPWDNQPTNSTCTLCPVGCSLILDERDGEIMRTRAGHNAAVNDIWLCDKGFFGYEFTYHQERLQKPLIRRGSRLEEASWDDAISLVAAHFQKAIPSGKLAGFGGNVLTVEENYLYQQLFRKGAHCHNLDHRIGMPLLTLDEEGIMPGMEITLEECEHLDFAFILGADITESFPLVWLRLKQAINKGARVSYSGYYALEIARFFQKNILHPPFSELEAIKDLENFLQTDKKGAIFVGSQYLSSPNRKAILSALLKLKSLSPNLSLNLLEGKTGSYGARFAGMRPDILPCYAPLDQPGKNAEEVLKIAASSSWDFLYVAGANPAFHFPSRLFQEARKKLSFLVVQDLFLTETAKVADVVLPALSFVEKGGSFMNFEGRLQTLRPGKEIPDEIYSDGEIFTKVAKKLQLSLELDPSFQDKLKDQKISFPRTSEIAFSESIKKENLNGDFFGCFAPVLFDQGVRMQHDPHLSELVKKPAIRMHPSDAEKRGISSGDIIRVYAQEEESYSLQAKVVLDNTVHPSVIVMPLGFEEVPVAELHANYMNGKTFGISWK